MKLIKIGVPLALCIGSMLLASENDSTSEKNGFLSSTTCHPYSSYEVNQLGFTQPSFGCKNEWKNFVLDASIGGKYLSMGKTNIKTITISSKLLYKFYKNDHLHLYAGIGADQVVNFYKARRGKREWWKKDIIKERNCYFFPSVVLGNQIKINDKNSIFFEFIYKPRIYGSSNSNIYGTKLSKTIHEDSFKIGLMY